MENRRRRRNEISQPPFSVMKSVGGFREGKINGKSFLIFTSLSQTDIPNSSGDEAAIDSGGDNLPIQPLFLCPSLRLKSERLKRKLNDDHSFLPINTSPYFPSIRTGDQQVRYLLYSNSYYYNHICKFPLVPLFWCNNKEPSYTTFALTCSACSSQKIGTDYYCCLTCGEIFHKECVEAPLVIKHPFYPFLSFQLYSKPTFESDYWFCKCICCKESIIGMAYHSPTYKLSIDPVCAMKPILFVTNHPKRHPHPLTLFSKQSFLPCNVCGLIKEHIPTYICALCAFVVHEDCIHFPYVIRISRHHHRVSFSSSLPSEILLSCGVCRGKVDNNCGAYSCNKCDDYFVHTRCALRNDLWDGEELDGVPEEPEIIVEPFEKIADGIILHFSHGHHLKLEITGVYDQDKFCQACALRIYEGDYYSCVDQCDFILHDACANSPLKIYHPLRPRPLTLKVVTNGYDNNKGWFMCKACMSTSCGFVYEVDEEFRLDLRCASISEPFEYQGHEHPLFLSLRREEEMSARCRICQDEYCRKLNCIECDYIICFTCATLPYKARYKHDEHFLSFYEAKEASNHSEWCDVCERKIADSSRKGFYSCDDCCSTVHIDCLLGKLPYLKPGQTVDEEVHILRNNTMSRPICHGCKHRCLDKLVFKKEYMAFCTPHCS